MTTTLYGYISNDNTIPDYTDATFATAATLHDTAYEVGIDVALEGSSRLIKVGASSVAALPFAVIEIARKAINWSSVGTIQEDKKICDLCPANKSLNLLREDVKRDVRTEENSNRYEEMRKVSEDKNYVPNNTKVIRLY